MEIQEYTDFFENNGLDYNQRQNIAKSMMENKHFPEKDFYKQLKDYYKFNKSLNSYDEENDEISNFFKFIDKEFSKHEEYIPFLLKLLEANDNTLFNSNELDYCLRNHLNEDFFHKVFNQKSIALKVAYIKTSINNNYIDGLFTENNFNNENFKKFLNSINFSTIIAVFMGNKNVNKINLNEKNIELIKKNLKDYKYMLSLIYFEKIKYNQKDEILFNYIDFKYINDFLKNQNYLEINKFKNLFDNADFIEVIMKDDFELFLKKYSKHETENIIEILKNVFKNNEFNQEYFEVFKNAFLLSNNQLFLNSGDIKFLFDLLPENKKHFIYEDIESFVYTEVSNKTKEIKNNFNTNSHLSEEEFLNFRMKYILKDEISSASKTKRKF